MIEAVSQERWQQAQAAEIEVVDYSLEGAGCAYGRIFDYLGINPDQEGKSIAEIGCGQFPAVMFCKNVLSAIVFEPLFEPPPECGVNIFWNRSAFEDFEYHFGVNECWLFNVLQHVRDPEAVIAKAKEAARTVRFFEPVDYPTCVYHPHTFSQGDFERWFPNSVKRYTDRLPAFFDDDCCYGTWTR